MHQLREHHRSVRLVHITTAPLALRLFFAGQIGYMRARGFEVLGIASPGSDLDEFAQREGVPVRAIPMARRISPFPDIVATVRLWRALRQIRPAIVHAHTPKGGVLGMISAWLAWTPVRVYHIRGLPFMTARGKKRILLRISERVACRLADQVLCVSHSIRDVAVTEGLCPPEKIKVLGGGSGNGVDAVRFDPHRVGDGGAQVRDRYGIPADAPVLLYIGRVVRDKGLIELTDAWSMLADAYPALHLIVAGWMEPQDPLPVEIEARLREDARIHLIGPCNDTPSLYAASDLVVLPTYREGFPNVPLEAAAMGLPIVATRIPGCVDAIVDGETGVLVPAGDATALAAAIRHYLNDPELRRRHGRAGRERVLRDFRQEIIWTALYQEYCRLLHERGYAPPPPLEAEDTVLDSARGMAP